MHDDTPDTGVEAPAVADTVETPTVEANVQVEQVAPEAAQSTEETSSEITATDTAEERLYAGKYKSVDDLEKSYQELQSKATKDAQEKAELARILNDTFTTPEATPVATDTDSFGGYEEPTVSVDPRIEAIERKDAVRDFVFAHPDADGETVNKILNSDPLVKNITGYEAKLEYAYLKSQANRAPVAVAEAEKRASEQAQVKIIEKQSAQVEGARQQTQPATNNELTPEMIRSIGKDDKAFDDLITSRFPGIAKMRTRT